MKRFKNRLVLVFFFIFAVCFGCNSPISNKKEFQIKVMKCLEIIENCNFEDYITLFHIKSMELAKMYKNEISKKIDSYNNFKSIKFYHEGSVIFCFNNKKNMPIISYPFFNWLNKNSLEAMDISSDLKIKKNKIDKETISLMLTYDVKYDNSKIGMVEFNLIFEHEKMLSDPFLLQEKKIVLFSNTLKEKEINSYLTYKKNQQRFCNLKNIE